MSAPETDVPHDDPAAWLAARLTAYDVQKLLVQGGMGDVYFGIHRALARPVAIKVLRWNQDQNPELDTQNLFIEEARAMARLNHPAIVQVHDFGATPEGLLYLVMEYVDGMNLEQVLTRRQTLPVPEAAAVASQVADALACAHGQGILHGDIKPANILIDSAGSVRLTDFGLTGHRDTGGASGIMGTPGYAAPELYQATGAHLEPRTDLYALGATLFEMLAGRPPEFPGEDPATLNPALNPRLGRMVARSIHELPDSRFQSAAEFKGALAAALAPPAASAVIPSSAAVPVNRPRLSSEVSVVPPRRRPRQRFPWGSIAVAALVVAAGIAGLKWQQSRNATADTASEAVAAADAAPTAPEPDAPAVPAAEPDASTPSTPPVAAAQESMAPPPAASAPSSPQPVASSETADRLKTLEDQFLAAVERNAELPYAEAMLDLTDKYRRALDQALANATQAARLEEALALKAEADLAAAGPLPGVDADTSSLPPIVQPLRATYLRTAAGHELNRLRSLQNLYQRYQDTLEAWSTELTQASHLDDALAVREAKAAVAARAAEAVPADQLANLQSLASAPSPPTTAVTAAPSSSLPAPASTAPETVSPPPVPVQDTPIRLESRVSAGKSDRLSKGELFDDRAVRMRFTVDVKNAEVTRDLQGAKATLVVFGKSVLDARVFKVFSVEQFDLDIVHQATSRFEGKELTMEYDDTGAAQYGYKYHGYALLVHDSGGRLILNSASPISWGKEPEKLTTLRAGAFIDRDFKEKPPQR